MLPGADERSKGDLRVMLNGLAAKMLFEKDLIVRREGERFGSLRPFAGAGAVLREERASRRLRRRIGDRLAPRPLTALTRTATGFLRA